MVQQMKMQEAQALAEIPLEETLISESSSSDNEKDAAEGSDEDHSGQEYDEEQDRAEVEAQIKKARYASQGPGKGKKATAGQK